MLKKILWIAIFSFFILGNVAFSEELHLIKDKLYLLTFDEEIQNINNDSSVLSAQIIHTIYDDRKQMILSLKSDESSILQIKTENKLYNYDIVNSKEVSKNLMEIDLPPIENLDVDVYTGD